MSDYKHVAGLMGPLSPTSSSGAAASLKNNKRGRSIDDARAAEQNVSVTARLKGGQHWAAHPEAEAAHAAKAKSLGG